MRFLGLEVKKAPKAVQKSLHQPIDRGWWTIYESFAGAWQTNTEVKLDSVIAHPTVFSCVSRIASDVSKLRLKLVQESEGVKSPISGGPVFDLLKRPNAFQNRLQFVENWLQSKLLHGNAYALVSRDASGVVESLHILDPRQVRPLVSSDGQVFYDLRQDNLTGLEESAVVPASEVIHDRMNALFHPLMGLSPIFACGLAATQGLAIQKNNTLFFENGATPGGVLSAPGEIKSETAQRLKDHWETNYSGENRGKIAVLGDGLKYEPMMMSAVDAQVIEQLGWSDQQVAKCYHMPAFMVGAGSVPESNNVQALTTLYYSQCLQSYIEALELALSEGLRLGDGLCVEFELDDLLRMDTETLVRSISEAVGSGIFAPDEARKRFNLGPVPGGSSPYLQQQNYSLEALAKRDAQADPFGTGGEPVEDVVERTLLAQRGLDQAALVSRFAAKLR